MSKKILSLQIPENLYNELLKEAKENYMSISAYTRMILIQLYKENLNGTN